MDTTDLETALVNEEAAGNSENARKIAGEILRVRAMQAPMDFNPTTGMNSFQRGAAGAGMALTNIATGIGQRLGMVPQSTVDENARLQAPLRETTAGKVGSVIGGAVPFIGANVLLPGVSSLGGAMLQQGAMGALQGAIEPTQTGGPTVASNVGAGALGGVAFGGLAHGLSRLLTPVPGISSSRLALANQASQKGFEFTPGQITNDPLIQGLEAASGKTPSITAANTAAANAIAAKSIGQSGNSLTPDVILRAQKDLGDRFAQLSKNTVINTASPTFGNAVSKLEAEYNLLEDPAKEAMGSAAKWIDTLKNWQQVGQIPGEVYQKNRSFVSRLAFKSTDPAQSNLYKDIVSAMDEAAPNTPAWNTLRQQYTNLSALKNSPNTISESGDVNTKALYNALFRKSGYGMRGDLAQLEQIVRNFPAAKQPSGSNIPGSFMKIAPMLGTAAAGGLAGGAGSFYYGARDPKDIMETALMGTGAGLLAPHLLQKALMNPLTSYYLTHGLVGGADFAPALQTLSPFASQQMIQRSP